jgi:putative hemolysin
VAGFVIDRLGRIPDTGEQVEHDGWVLEVAEMAGVRVSRLLVTRATGADTDSDTTEVEA